MRLTGFDLGNSHWQINYNSTYSLSHLSWFGGLVYLQWGTLTSDIQYLLEISLIAYNIGKPVFLSNLYLYNMLCFVCGLLCAGITRQNVIESKIMKWVKVRTDFYVSRMCPNRSVTRLASGWWTDGKSLAGLTWSNPGNLPTGTRRTAC